MPMTKKNWKTGTKRYGTKNTRTSYRTHSTNTRTHNTTNKSFSGTAYNPTLFKNYQKNLQAKIGSYRTINQQLTGTGKVTAFSPTAANKWIKYVDQGAYVYKFSNAQFAKFFGKQWNNPTPTTACRYLKQKYGQGIKAVTKGKGNNWLVVATPKVTARPFSSYTWK